MNYITHSLGGVAAGLAVISAAGISDPIQKTTVMAGAVLGSLFPDIDHRQSWIGHKAPIVAEVASGLFKHRGFLHTPVFILLMWILLSAGIPIWFGGIQNVYFALLFKKAFIWGMFSHLILDTLNVQGIMWLWPISQNRLHVLPIRTGGLGETVVCVILGVMLLGQYKVLF